MNNVIPLGKTFMILAISIGVTSVLTQNNIDALFGYFMLLIALYGYYVFEKYSSGEKVRVRK